MVVWVPAPVPRWMVTPSRKMLSSPMTVAEGSPWYLRSWGQSPRTAKEWTLLRAPMVSEPRRRAWDWMMQLGPMATGPSMTAYGPTVVEGSMIASLETMAVGWMDM